MEEGDKCCCGHTCRSEAELVGEIKHVRERTGVIEIGLKSLGYIGLLTLGTGVIMALFH